MNYSVGFATDIGLRRQQNQDCGGTYPELGLFVVADGMGGHKGGEIASAMSVASVSQVVKNGIGRPGMNPKILLKDAISAANQSIYERSVKQAELQGMGTTTTAILFHQNRVHIGHVGDSRCYFFRNQAVWQVTRDHSLVQEKLRAGLITREQAKTDQMKNVITRSVGFGHETMVELYEMSAVPGDIFLLCSDGLSGLMEDVDMLRVIQQRVIERDEIKDAVADLISLANARGGHDNITVAVIQVLS